MPTYSDTTLQQLIINKLTLSQYEQLTPDPNQLYFIDDGGAVGGSSTLYQQITLNTSSWSSNQYSATVSGMTSTAIVWVNPTDDSKTYWTRANVRAISQATDLLTFSCTDQQLASYMSLNVNVIWAEPVSQS